MRRKGFDRLAAQEAAEILGQRRTLPYGEHARFWAGMVDDRRDIPGGKDLGMGNGLKRILHGDKTLLVRSQASLSRPVGGAGRGDPQKLIQSELGVIGKSNATFGSTGDKTIRSDLNPSLLENAPKRGADARVVGRQNLGRRANEGKNEVIGRPLLLGEQMFETVLDGQ